MINANEQSINFLNDQNEQDIIQFINSMKPELYKQYPFNYIFFQTSIFENGFSLKISNIIQYAFNQRRSNNSEVKRFIFIPFYVKLNIFFLLKPHRPDHFAIFIVDLDHSENDEKIPLFMYMIPHICYVKNMETSQQN